MIDFILIARLLLIGIFLTAAVAKLSDRTGSRRAIIGFGFPSSIATVLGYLLPIAELAIASVLVIDEYAWWGALGGLVLLFLFSVVISINMSLGRKPSCHCFGQLHSAPVGWKVMIRNGILVIVAGFMVIQGSISFNRGSIMAWLRDLTPTQLEFLFIGTTLAAIVIVSYFLFRMHKENKHISSRNNLSEVESKSHNDSVTKMRLTSSNTSLAVGTASPEFKVTGIDHKTYTLSSLIGQGKAVLLIFFDPNCGHCNALLPQIHRWQLDHSNVLTTSLISRGSSQVNHNKATQYGLQNVLIQKDREVAQSYKAYGTPSGILIHTDGNIGSRLAFGAEQISSLVEQALENYGFPEVSYKNENIKNDADFKKINPEVVQIGERIPPIKLKDMSGESWDLLNLRGNVTLVLFWDPDCLYCKEILEVLQEKAPTFYSFVSDVLIISTSDSSSEHKSKEIANPRFKVVIDPEFVAGRALGVADIPSAVIVDSQCNIASNVAKGPKAVLELIGIRQSHSARKIAEVEMQRRTGGVRRGEGQ